MASIALSDLLNAIGLPQEVLLNPAHSSQYLLEALAPLVSATKEHLSFLANAKYLPALKATQAGAVFVREAQLEFVPPHTIAIVVSNPYAAFARASQVFGRGLARGVCPGTRHPSAVVDANAQVDPTADIGPLVVVESGARVGANAVLSAGVVIGCNAHVGANAWLGPRVVVYRDCIIGDRSILHAGVVIGADGFGFAPDAGEWIKIEQLGAVQIGEDVEIGANTTIDRGALGNTVIGRGCKLDNQIQIGHNSQIGEFTVISAGAGVAGSTVIGKHCLLGGMCGVVGHVTVADGVTISAMTVVMSNIDKPGVYSGVFPMQEHRAWEKTAAVLRNLPELRQRLRQVERIQQEQKI
jgi:UDP-3-O-[3-hydroxymyristoyl] glucosamine N-acyltransferase